MHGIALVAYSSDAGPILPELQWHEEVVITKRTITLVRKGRVPETQVNVGHWEWPADEGAVATLFAQLEPIECGDLRRVEPADAPDGGHTESYSITYGRKQRCELRYDPGVIYIGGDQVVGPVQAFLRGLSLPPRMA
ncbi:hypothetical protein [Candidatus Oscillochloris fontis]|uniref:hypothetical protein n=1 Tax=Candidatus Oscillochloris fontis TaxID=2496868 RepID=UPI00101BAD5D|nr:hypothetical protein [Candidatus Oscillochloris fontis]